jgi:MinD superfamily P-loop ATPase
MKEPAMIYIITDKCIECGCCALYCKQHDIFFEDGRYIIQKELCDGCGVCVEYCPIDDAIVAILSLDSIRDI